MVVKVRSTQEDQLIQGTNSTPIQNDANNNNADADTNGTNDQNDTDNEEWRDLFTNLHGFFDDPRGYLAMEHNLFVSPEWKTENFDPIHVNQFKNLTGFVPPSPLNPETAMPIDYFQMYIPDTVSNNS